MRTRIIAGTSVGILGIVLVAAYVAWWWNSDPERRWGCFRNDYARCVGCGSFIGGAMDQFLAEKKDGWLPRGGTNAADSLAQLSPWLPGGGARNFTSHALTPKLRTHWREHHTLTYEFMCYRYNEGLRTDDPKHLIVMYHCKPSRWESNDKKRYFIGRPVMTLDFSPAWDFIPEAEFQLRQKETEEYLLKNRRIGASRKD